MFDAVVGQGHTDGAVAIDLSLPVADLRHVGLQHKRVDLLLHRSQVDRLAIRDHATHRTAFTQNTGERAGINAAHAGHFILL